MPGWSPLTSFNLAPGAAAHVGAFQSWTRVTPARAPTPSGDVLVPLAQSLITGAVVCLATGAVAYMQRWSVYVPLGIGAATFTASWLWLLADHRSLLRVTETVQGGNDRPPITDNQPAPAMRLEVVEHHAPNSDTMRFLDLPCDDEVFRPIARGVRAGHPFSEREWAGPSRPLSGPKFRTLQDKLLAAGYMRWNSQADHRQGVALTRKGAELFRQATGGEQ